MAGSSSDSILIDIKKSLGLAPDYDAFDEELILFINGELSALRQVGLGPEDGLAITGDSETWDQLFVIENPKAYNDVKTFLHARVRLMFDPPGNSFGIEALNKRADEMLWRINFEYELNDPKYDENGKERDDYDDCSAN